MKKEEILIPRKGLIVRDPESKNILPETGALKPLFGKFGTFWKRRIKCGDVIVKKETKKNVAQRFLSKNIKKEK